MKRKKIAIILSFIIIFCVSCSREETPSPKERSTSSEPSRGEGWVGQRVPDFTLKDALTSEDISPSDLIGKKVIYITWWATWCKACVEEIPRLKELYSKFKDEGFDIIAINVKESQEKVARFVKKKEIPYHNLLDFDGEVSKKFKIVGIPINLIIDSKGIIKYYGSTIPPDVEDMIRKLTGELQSSGAGKSERSKKGKPAVSQNFSKASEFVLNDINGRKVRLSTFKNKVIVLNFWATWCPPCRMEIPHLIQLQKEYSSKGVQVIGISVDKAGVEKVRNFAEKKKINYPVLMSNDKVIIDYNGTGNLSIPRTIIIDRDKNIREKLIGLRDKKALEAIISKFI